MVSKQKSTGTGQGMPLLTGFAGIVIVFLILVFANVLVAEMNIRWDATAENLYSLSASTKNIASKLKRPVTIKFFYSEDNINIPANIKAYAKRVRDFLGEYENVGAGKISVEVINPVYDSDEEDLAQKYGIKGLSLQSGERVYFGLVALSADQEEVIQYLDPAREAQLEYDVTRAITRVQNATKEKIALISGLPLMGGMPMGYPMQQGMPKPWLFVTELKKTYEVSMITKEDEKIPSDIKLLMIMNPDTISDNLLKEIDGYVARGGNVIAITDPVNISGEANPMAGGKGIDRNFEKLLAAWGVEMDSQKIVADYFYPTQLYSQRNPGSVEANPTWISVQKAAFNHDDTITGRLENMLFPIAGALNVTEKKGVKVTTLIKTSKSSALVESFKAQLGGELAADFKPTGDEYKLAVKLTGKMPSVFDGGSAPSGDKGTADEAGKKDQQLKPSTVIVVSDADFIYDSYYVEKQNFLGFEMAQVFNDNLNFILNASELLTGNPELAEIRAGGTFSRPFTKVRDMELKAREKWYAQEIILEKRAEETNQKLQALNSKKSENQTFVLNPEQEAEIKRFQEEKRNISRELKSVRRNLRADIESLGNVIKLANIFFMPFCIMVAGIVLAIRRRQRS